MARDGHDYDHGCHAPWCGKCGAEEDAVSDAENTFDYEQADDCQALVNKIHALTAPTLPVISFKPLAEQIESLAMELTERASEKFDADQWLRDQADRYDGPDTIEEARGER